jgi:hypothetical protein
MKQLTERYTIMLTHQQKQSLDTLSTYNVNVSQFIRSAIKEKLSREWKTIKEKKNKTYCPF